MDVVWSLNEAVAVAGLATSLAQPRRGGRGHMLQAWRVDVYGLRRNDTGFIDQSRPVFIIASKITCH